MKEFKVRRTVYYTRNLGNFENAKVGYEIEATVEEGETVDEVRKKLKAKTDKWLEEDIHEVDAEAAARKG